VVFHDVLSPAPSTSSAVKTQKTQKRALMTFQPADGDIPIEYFCD